MTFNITGGLIGEIIIILAIALVLFIIIKLGRSILKLLFGIIINSVVGIIAFVALNYLLGLGIVLTIGLFIPIALFGLPAVGTIILLKMFAVAL